MCTEIPFLIRDGVDEFLVHYRIPETNDQELTVNLDIIRELVITFPTECSSIVRTVLEVNEKFEFISEWTETGNITQLAHRELHSYTITQWTETLDPKTLAIISTAIRPLLPISLGFIWRQERDAFKNPLRDATRSTWRDATRDSHFLIEVDFQSRTLLPLPRSQ